jgi:hypothetical protein
MTAIRENEKELEKYFQEIGSAAAAVLPKDWVRTVIGYFVEEESEVAYQQFFFLSESSDDYVDVLKEAWNNNDYAETAADIKMICKKIRSTCIKAHDKWSSMTMSIERNGSFNTDFSYEPISNFNNAFALDWQSEYLD